MKTDTLSVILDFADSILESADYVVIDGTMWIFGDDGNAIRVVQINSDESTREVHD